jgi:probable F420-dependent oxidoreductase
MKFGFSMFARLDRDAKEPMADVFKVAERAEELGYDHVAVGHHRFTPESRYPFVTLAAIAARTSKLRLGTAIHLLTLQHPLDVAEEVATLDELSGGRAFIGAGSGYRSYEYDALGIPFSERGPRMSEAYRILHRTWTEEHVTFRGRFYSFDDVTLSPRPIQQPIPIWAGANQWPAVRRAAEDADGWLIGFSDKLDSLGPKTGEYRRLAAEHGRPSTVCLMRLVGVAPSRDEVEDRWFPPVLGMLRQYRRLGAPAESNPELRQRLRSSGDHLTIDQMGTDMIVAGTPDDCIQGIRRFEAATGCEYLHLFLGPQVDTPWGLEQLELFAREVMPAFADA